MHEGDLLVADDAEIRGLVTGAITVTRGGNLRLYGTCAHDLTVEAGAVARAYGTVGGRLVNTGGKAYVWGIVSLGLLNQAGETTVYKDAIVGSERVDADRVVRAIS